MVTGASQSTIMPPSETNSPTAEALEQIEDFFIGWVVDSLDECDSAQRPIKIYEQEIASETAFINEAFNSIYHSLDTDRKQKVKDDIVDHAGNLAILKIKYKDANEVSEVRCKHILQRLCDKMFKVLGPTFIRHPLEQIPRDKVTSYLPRAALGGVDSSAVHPDREWAATDPRGPQGGTPEVEGMMERSYRTEGDTPPTKKRRISTAADQSHSISIAHVPNEHLEDETISNESRNHQAEVIPQSSSNADKEAPDNAISNTVTNATGARAKPQAMFEITDSEGIYIKWVRQAEAWTSNDRIHTLTGFPVKRPVTIRQKRKQNFIQAHLESISSQTETRDDTKLLSCLIQATGETMDGPCRTCRRKWGPFQGCIRLQHSRLPNCGNCEWNRKGCRGATALKVTAVEQNSSDGDDAAQINRQQSTGHAFSDFEARGNSLANPAYYSPASPTKSHATLGNSRLSLRVSDQSLTPSPGDVISQPPTQALDENGKEPLILNPEFRIDEVSETETDSQSGNTLNSTDFRILQVKNRLFTTEKETIQYWSWRDVAKYFKHQILENLNPVRWGALRDPADFDIWPSEISEIKWSLEALFVQINMKGESSSTSALDGAPRGNVMAAFKSEPTMRRIPDVLLWHGTQHDRGKEVSNES
ncbi:hypothetical protein QQS21_007544 [Conoideocrella luteorostrata]|uniref:Uncharacterized protein n=1 Tax=Conoideocrella luteorostrata TaxID=1105319 RepID=A0AAJ0FRZ2_9HYPO|nr:hypothetical protein QQS21_007544 [Conoideocrella luteorostrata]